ncbi:MAG: ABC transporter permease subunit, partial [Planctomycetota bacterium]|nr:ABC transporter permease subunit [Planctomycetota bacterium]
MSAPLTLLALVPEWLSNWITPIWVLSNGVLAGLALLAIIWVVVACISRRWAADLWETSTEGVLQSLLWLAAVVAAIVLAGFLAVRDPWSLLAAVPRLTASGVRSFELDLPPADLRVAVHDNPPVVVPGPFLGREFKELKVESDTGLLISAASLDSNTDSSPSATIEVKPDTPMQWSRSAGSELPWGSDRIDNLYVYSLSDVAGKFRMEIGIAPQHDREAGSIPVAALATVGFVLCFWVLRLAVPQMAAIAHTTAKSEMAQPLFVINLLLGSFLLVIFIFVPYNTMGEDIKMLKDSGFAAMMVLGIVQAVWGASTSVFEEVEGRTALTVLSKPISRRQFLLGKFLGIVSVVALMFVVLGFLFLVVVAYKPIYDARENSELAATWEQCFNEVRLTVPGLTLAFMEVVVLAAISVAISTRLPMLANFIICATIYVLGHLTPLIVQSSVASFEPVVFVGTLIATLIPVLDHF